MKKNRNIVKRFSEIRDGSIRSEQQLVLNEILMESSFLSNMELRHTFDHIFNKMLSSLEWHPKHNLILIGSRGGDVCAVNNTSKSVTTVWRGEGRGAQITDIKFDYLDNNWFYTSSTSGKLVKRRIDAKEDIILKDSYNLSINDSNSCARFSCLDICKDRKLVIAGDSNGNIHLTPSCELNTNTNSYGFSVGIHNSNILHCEFNRFNSNLFITASIDCSAKLWDLRMFSDRDSKPVLNLKHSRPLNSATFSANGSTLLTTNHFDEICVYRGPDWQLEKCIKHSHEQTLRFCLLKAKWHPLCDIFIIGSFSSNPSVCGQYYDKPQTIDVIDVKSGQIISSYSDGSPGVISISSFSPTGDKIAAIKGQNLIIFESIAKS